MYKRRNKRIVVLLILAGVMLVAAIVFYNSQSSLRRQYKAIESGGFASAEVTYLFPDDKEAAEGGGQVKWRFVFDVTHNGSNKKYTSVTVHGYSKEQMNLITDSSGKLPIKYKLSSDGSPATSSSDPIKINLNGVETTCYLAVSYEARYFQNSRPPSTTSSMILFGVFSALMLGAVYNYIANALNKSVEKKGELAYAYFVEASTSRMGSRRYMAVTYRYQNALDEWVEAKTPYTFSSLEVERLKEMDVFSIKYRGNRAVIVEKFKNAAI